MKFHRNCAALIGFLMVLVGHAALAQQPTPYIGNWIDRLPDGTAMVTSITPYTVTFSILDHNGNTNGPPTTISVAASKFSEDSYMLTPTGAVGEPMAVKVKDANTMYLQFEGRNPRMLRRQQEEAPSSPHSK